jgi:hypothetical protein
VSRALILPRCWLEAGDAERGGHFSPFHRRICAMARGVQKSNKEKRKPKQDKNKPGAKK